MSRVRFHRYWLGLPIVVGSFVSIGPLFVQAADSSSTTHSSADAKTASGNPAAGAKSAPEGSNADAKPSSDSPGGLAPAELASRLETAKEQEERLDIELRSGKSYTRCRLLRLDRAGESGPPKMLRLETEDARKPISIDFASIRTLSIGRQVMYEVPIDKKSGRDMKLEKESKAAAEARAQWVARAEKRGVAPWPELTSEEHKAAIEENSRQIEKIKAMFPGMEVSETSEFTFCSNIPRNQVGPYIASLDKMYDLLCRMYGIKKGTPVWRGKCLVVAFIEQSQFADFEKRFFQLVAPANIYGLCHQIPTGRVVMACYRGNDPNDFAQMLVHETSHGFNFRYRTQQHLPSWVDEGMAEWIGETLVPKSTSVQRSEQASLRAMKGTHGMQGVLDSKRIAEIPDSYGIASSLTTFLVRADQKKYVDFINGIKEGKRWQESLKDSYHATVEQLVTAYGRSIGIPDLRP